MDWDRLADLALTDRPISGDDARAVLTAPDEAVLPLVAAAARVRRTYFGTTVKLNYLVNIKSGLCPEDCHYCSQSSVSTAGVARHPLLSVDAVTAAADHAVGVKAARFCMVASGRGPTDGELEIVGASIRAVRAAHPTLEVCACLGLLKDGQAERLREVGAFAYNHNLNTSERFYGRVCTTHGFEDRLATIRRAKGAGLSACAGALFGMGEGPDDVIELAYALRELGVDSIPLNFLIAIPGTPLADRSPLSPLQCLRILCLFRFLNPRSELRIAGGREVQLRWLQPLGLYVANSIFVGDYLTTKGQPPEADFAMIRDLGFTVLGHESAPLAEGGAPGTPRGLGDDAGRVTTRPNQP